MVRPRPRPARPLAPAEVEGAARAVDQLRRELAPASARLMSPALNLIEALVLTVRARRTLDPDDVSREAASIARFLIDAARKG